MKIYYVYDGMWRWVPGIILMEALKLMGHEVTEFNIRTYPNLINQRYSVYKEPIPIKPEGDFDYIFIVQSAWNCINKTKIPCVYYSTEALWYPSCENPDFIMSVFPEMEAVMTQKYPRHLANCKYFMDFQICHIPDKFIDVSKKKGIFWQGWDFADDIGTAEYRQVYKYRKKVVSDLYYKEWLNVKRPNYGQNFLWEICQWEAGLVVDGYNTFFSPRPIELAFAKSIPIIWLQNEIHRKYYNERGFIHKENCFMFDKVSKVKEYIQLSDEKKLELGNNAHTSIVERYHYKKKLEVLFRILGSVLS